MDEKPLYPTFAMCDLEEQILANVKYALKLYQLPEDVQEVIGELIDQSNVLCLENGDVKSSLGDVVPAVYWNFDTLDNLCREHLKELSIEQVMELTAAHVKGVTIL
jgi:regulator of replication initiation timing